MFSRLLKAARGDQAAEHKYLRREGTPGHYKYIYTEPGERKEPGRNARKNLTILSMGLGRDSITMLLLAREGRLMVDGEAFSGDDLDAVAFSDPGYEWPHTYALIPRVKKICQEMNVPFLILQKPKKEGKLGWQRHHDMRLARQKQRGEDHEVVTVLFPTVTALSQADPADLAKKLASPKTDLIESTEDRAAYYVQSAKNQHKKKRIRDKATGNERAETPAEVRARVGQAPDLRAPVKFEPSWVSEGKKKETLEERAQAGTYHTRGPILEDYERLCKITLRASAACTSNQKISPINSRLVNDMSTLKFGVGSSKGEWGREVTAGNREKHRILIGIAADEEHRLRGAEDSASTSNFTRPVYPLADMGIAKPDEQEILERHGLGDTRKSGCVGCHFQPTSWYWALRELQPEAFQRVVEYEERAIQFAKENGLTVKYLGGTKPLPGRVDAFVARHNPTPEDVDRILDKEYGRAKKESKQIGLDLVGIGEPRIRGKKKQQAAILLMDDNPDAEQLGLFAMSTRYLMDLSKARTPFRSLLKAARGQAYQGKGKRKGTPRHYTYEYDEPQQGSFASILQETRPAPSKPAPQKDEPWFDVYGPRGAPRPGEKGYKEDPTRPPGAHDGQEPYDLVIDMLDQASRVWSDEDWAQIYQGGHPDFEYSDLPDLIGVPARDGNGELYSENDRSHIAERMIELARETREEWAEGGDLDIPLPETTQSRKSTETKPLWSIEPYRDGFHFPKWVVAAALADSMDRDNLKMRLALVSKDEARAFIEKHHSALPYLNPKGLMYAIGVKRGGRLVAVATAGTPTGNWSKTGRDPHQIVELTRVASDGTAKGAASKLVSRLIDLMPQSGRSDPDKPALLVTYQLESESGTTYTALRDKGLRPVASVRGSAPSGARAGASTQSLAHVDKIVWEAGPEARPAKWGLLESADQVEMLKAARGQAYQGKGKRTGTPGHYEYDYDEPKRGRRKRTPQLPKEESPHRSEGGKVGMVTVAGRKLSAEKTDTDDTFPPAIAAFKVIDGWLAYRGRNGSEGVVVGRRSELDKWKADVQKYLKQVPIAQPAKQWRESDGGKDHIEFATEAANRTAKAFGQPAPKLEFLVDGKSRASGEAGHNKLTVVNAHTGSRTDYTGVFEGINTHGGAHIAAHETTHWMYGVNPQAGKKAEAAVAAHAKEHGAITMYHATSNHHEGLMEATALFVLNKRAMESKAPKLARAIAAWMTEVSTLHKARGQAYQGKGKRTGTPGHYEYDYDEPKRGRRKRTPQLAFDFGAPEPRTPVRSYADLLGLYRDFRATGQAPVEIRAEARSADMSPRQWITNKMRAAEQREAEQQGEVGEYDLDRALDMPAPKADADTLVPYSVTMPKAEEEYENIVHDNWRDEPWADPDWAPDLASYDQIVISSSGGKDSQAMLDRMIELADAQGVDREHIVVVHADLGRSEWDGTKELARKQAHRYGVRFHVVWREAGDLLDSVLERFDKLTQKSLDQTAIQLSGVRTWDQLVALDAEILASLIEHVEEIEVTETGQSAAREVGGALIRAKKMLTNVKTYKLKAQVKAEEKAVAAEGEVEDLVTALADEASPKKQASIETSIVKARAKATDLREAAEAARMIDFGEIVPWFSAKMRFCTADHKRGQINKALTTIQNRHKQSSQHKPRVLNCQGLRAQESASRAKRPAFKRNSKAKSRHEDVWYPIQSWSEEKVWDRIRASGTPYAESYDLGMSRLSCVFCMMASDWDLRTAAYNNPDLLEEYIEVEARTGKSFKPDMSMTDLKQWMQAPANVAELKEYLRERQGSKLYLPGSDDMGGLVQIGEPLSKAMARYLERLFRRSITEIELREGTPVEKIVFDYKANGACLHFATATDSIHVTYFPYPHAYGAAIEIFAIANKIGLLVEEHGAPNES